LGTDQTRWSPGIYPRTVTFPAIYHYLPLIIKYSNVNANPLTTLFADNTSILVNNLNNAVQGNNLKSVFICVMKWFKANVFSLNLEKAYCMEFNSKHTIKSDIQIKYNNKTISNKLFEVSWVSTTQYCVLKESHCYVGYQTKQNVS
jgi:hypothetical protein